MWFKIYVKIYNKDNIICAKFTWVRSVHVLCAPYCHPEIKGMCVCVGCY
jgi:hypothetical protein